VHAGAIYRSGLTAQAHPVPEATRAECAEIGATLAAGLSGGLW